MSLEPILIGTRHDPGVLPLQGEFAILPDLEIAPMPTGHGPMIDQAMSNTGAAFSNRRMITKSGSVSNTR